MGVAIMEDAPADGLASAAFEQDVVR